jgi:hypothetical protein
MTNSHQRLAHLAFQIWSYERAKTVKSLMLWKERNVCCMLPPPFNLITILLAPFHYYHYHTERQRIMKLRQGQQQLEGGKSYLVNRNRQPSSTSDIFSLFNISRDHNDQTLSRKTLSAKTISENHMTLKYHQYSLFRPADEPLSDTDSILHEEKANGKVSTVENDDKEEEAYLDPSYRSVDDRPSLNHLSGFTRMHSVITEHDMTEREREDGMILSISGSAANIFLTMTFGTTLRALLITYEFLRHPRSFYRSLTWKSAFIMMIYPFYDWFYILPQSWPDFYDYFYYKHRMMKFVVDNEYLIV